MQSLCFWELEKLTSFLFALDFMRAMFLDQYFFDSTTLLQLYLL